MLPRVSCIMVTARRPQFIERSIKYFLAQSYLNKELVIIDNGESPVAERVPNVQGLGGSRMIRYYHARRPEQTIGALRNAACDVTNGDLIAHWDDDDWYHPDRLAYQVEQMGDATIGGLHSCLFYDEVSEPACLWRYSSGGGYALGATLMYKRAFWRSRPFLDTSTGEDNAFQDETPAATAPGLLDSGKCYFIARMHETNSQRVLHETIRRSWEQDPERINLAWFKMDRPEDQATIDKVKGLLA